MTLLEALMSLRPEDCAEGTVVEGVKSNGEVVRITFGKRVPVEPARDFGIRFAVTPTRQV